MIRFQTQMEIHWPSGWQPCTVVKRQESYDEDSLDEESGDDSSSYSNNSD